MDLDELRSVQSRERQTDSLQQLRETFYQDVGEYIESLKAERERAADAAEDPWNDHEVGRLSDDIETAEQTVEAIYERRVGKIVKMASLAAADMPTEDDGLTEEEQRLFESLVAEIEENRAHVEAVLDGDTPPGETDGSDPATSASSTQSAGPAQSVGSAQSTTEDVAAPSDHGPADAATDDGARTPNAEGGTPSASTPDESGGVDAADLMGSGEDTSESTTGTGESESAGRPAVDAASDSASAPSPDASTDASGGDQRAPPSKPRQQSDGGPDEATEPTPDGGDGGQADDTAEPPVAAANGAGTDVAKTDTGTKTDAGTKTSAETGASDGAASESSSVDRTTVRITDDVGEIYGVDQRSYDLSPSDVVTLPEKNASPLVERGAAERLD